MDAIVAIVVLVVVVNVNAKIANVKRRKTMKPTTTEKTNIRLLIVDTLLRDLYHDWMTMVEQDIEDGSEDTNKLYVRCRRYFEDNGITA